MHKYKNILQRNIHVISETLIVDSGEVLPKLIEYGVFSCDEAQEILAEVTYTKKAFRLVGILLKKPDINYALFIKSLREGAHSHLADILEKSKTTPDEIQEDCEQDFDESKMSKYKAVLKNNIQNISESLLVGNVIPLLVQYGVLDYDDSQEIDVEKTDKKKSLKLIKILLNKPYWNWSMLMRSFREGSHEHVEELLTGQVMETLEAAVATVTECLMDEPFLEIDVHDCDKKWAQRMLKKEREVYPMKNALRGRFILLINIDYKQTERFSRDGGVFDVLNLDQLFTRLNFSVETWNDYSNTDLRKAIERERKHPVHAVADAFIFCILAKASDGKLLTVDNEQLDLDEVFSAFDDQNCPDLRDKPKIFLINFDRTYREPLTSEFVSLDPEDPSSKAKSDFIIVYSSLPGCVSWRNTQRGTYFIRDLCSTFMERCHVDHLDDILKEMIRKQKQRSRPCQVSQIHTSCSRNLYFFPGYTDSNNMPEYQQS